MIEFHRLKGNQTMVFWRFSVRKFARFNKGDLVFFIDRRYRHPQTQEKGIIGYGRCEAITNNSVKQVWEQHKTNTGYTSYEAFKTSIKYYRKDENRLPSQIQVIKLKGVVFLQNPIFLSEIGIDLSERLESFTYIEKEGKDASNELLDLVQLVGVDQWMMSQNHDISVATVEQDKIEQTIRSKLDVISYSLTKEQTRLIKNRTECAIVNDIIYRINNKVIFYLPITHEDQLYSLMGLQFAITSVLSEYETEFIYVPSAKIKPRLLSTFAMLNLKHE